MNFIFPDTPEAIAAAEPIYDFGWIFIVIGVVLVGTPTLIFLYREFKGFIEMAAAFIAIAFGLAGIIGGALFSFHFRPTMIAEAQAASPQPASITAIFQQAAEDTYGLTLTEQNTKDLLTREGYYMLERHQLEGDMRDKEPGQVWRAGKIEIAPDGQYQALQLIWVDDEWLIIDITDPNQAGIAELPHLDNAPEN